MQQILDRTQESLSLAFASLARNARRQQQLYYATVALLVAIVIVSGLLLAGLAAARHLDARRSHIAQYVGTISLQLQGEAAFLRRTALTIAHYTTRHGNDLPTPALLDQIRRTGLGMSADGKYGILVPDATRRLWGDALPARIWQLEQIATATLTTQMALELDHQAYIVDPDARYAIVLSPGGIPDLASVGPAQVVRLRNSLAGHLLHATESSRSPPTRSADPNTLNVPQWFGPVENPLLPSRAMIAVLQAAADDGRGVLVASSVPAEAFLARLQRPSEPATLWLLNREHASIDMSPRMDEALAGRVMHGVRNMPPDVPRLTRDGLLLVQPLGAAFGSLVYYLPYGTLLGAIASELILILAIGVVLVACLLLTARYWDVHLLRRSHAEAARALESETISHILVSATPIGLCIVRQHDDAILTSNAVAESLLGCGQGARLPAHITDALRQEGLLSAPRQLAAIAQVNVAALPASNGRPAVVTETAVGTAPQFLQITCAPARYRDETVLFCAIQDITAQHQLEQQLRTARETAEATMRARSNFFASMSHEIRTPLNALLGNLELLARAGDLEAHAPRLRALQVASEGLQRIVNDILDFSKIDAGEMKLVNEPFRPIDDLENLSMSYAPLAQDKPMRFYVHLSPTLDTTLRGDRTRIAQIIANLLSNAFKFTLCGKITLSGEVRSDTQGRSVLVCKVSDSGIGMPPALVARIFHPFVQGEASTSARYGGTGLGLSICARLTELMNGHITVESVEGVGTAFTVVVPLDSVATASAPAAPLTRGTRVMILCQESESGTVLQAWMERAGCSVDVFHNMAAAQSWLRANRPHVFVVTGEYGLDTITALRQHHAANALWLTRNGPDHPVQRGSGVFEVLAFSHTAILAGILAAVNAEPDADIGPPVDNHATETSAAPRTAPNAAAAHRRILVAEDNVLNQTLIAEQLNTLGWEPVVVGDGRLALSSLEHGEFDVVLTDLHMPVMDGYQLLAAIRATAPNLPVLAFSAVTHSMQADEWKSSGFSGYVAKPASLKSLAQALAAIPLADAAVQQPPDDRKPEASPIPASEMARYRGLLREHLDADGPELAGILVRHDPAALRQWAHRSAGAFAIVNAQDIVALCRRVEALCDGASAWTEAIGATATALQDAVTAFRTEAESTS